MITALTFVGIAFACFVLGGVAGVAHARISRRTNAVYYVIDLYAMRALDAFEDAHAARVCAESHLFETGHAYAVAIGEWFGNK